MSGRLEWHEPPARRAPLRGSSAARTVVVSRLSCRKYRRSTSKWFKSMCKPSNKHCKKTVCPYWKCSENCILCLRNRHVVILSSLKLWRKEPSPSLFLLNFRSEYFLRHSHSFDDTAEQIAVSVVCSTIKHSTFLITSSF